MKHFIVKGNKALHISAFVSSNEFFNKEREE